MQFNYKNIWPGLWFVAGVSFLLFGCGNQPYKPMAEYSGYAQGTTFHIICDSSAKELDREIEQLFKEVDYSMSLWDSTSIISRFNKSKNGLWVDEHFYTVFELSRRIYDETGGAFNPAVYPLVQLWGFGADRFSEDSVAEKNTRADSLLKWTKFSDFTLTETVRDSAGKKFRWLGKRHPENKLDFNGIAQGYTVDLLCTFLDKKGIENYMVEVGGEVRAKGANRQMKPWQIGIDKPTPEGETRIIQAIVNLENKSLATSGNYRKFYEKDGKKFSHTIDPATGKPAENMLLSTSVFAPTAAEADAYATAFMVMGAGKATEFLRSRKQLSAYLISAGFGDDFQIWMSPELEKIIRKKN
jgi:thiamine biosynthesis lipoprotein